ncbi:putative bifunctional diguanylate cyclase/phosphodiesterase [Undibacterium sp. SXout7W]|uniref:putative bifunctional diguanylate cyclase/phosphodiesterase n=1 Tax=Undibacterium sp. SXout7W TaxID=3413049 RepID=UPI003BF44F87
MGRWSFLKESAFFADEHSDSKLNVLRVMLLSGFFLEMVIALHSTALAWSVNAYPVLAVMSLLCSLLLTGVYYSSVKSRFSAATLILCVYMAAWSVDQLSAQDHSARFGFLFIGIAPVIARLFWGMRSAFALISLNIILFILLLTGKSQWHPQAMVTDSVTEPLYLQTLMFLFFNICVPLTMFWVFSAFDKAALRIRQANQALEISHGQYQEIFQNAGSAILLTDAAGKILQANHLADILLGRDKNPDDDHTLFEWLSLDNSVRLKPSGADESASMRMSAYRNRDGKMVAVENISQTSNDHYIVALRDVSGLHSMHNALQLSLEREGYLSSHDPLTNLPNRDMLRAHLESILSDPDNNKLTALVSFRLNSIRHANQQFGTYMGDVLLRRFAEELKRALPGNCFCARLRSIVFSFVVDHARTPGEIIKLVERIRLALPKEIEINGESVLVHFSAGIALIRPEDLLADDLIRRSEVALDTARRSSDQSVTLFDEDDALQIRRSVEIEVGIVNGLKQNEFRLLYQPKVNYCGDIAGMEALLRWKSASLGHVPPSEFIPIAERAGLIRHISDFVLEQTCAQIRRWLDQFGRCPTIAINLSASDIARTDLLQLIERNCQRYQIAPHFLEFEITETGLTANESLSIEHLDVLKARGFGIAIDDFGTGYSSLSKLSHFPAHSVKIDRSFVAQIGYNQKSEMIIKAIVSLANILSCTTVAEGVENESQEAFLQDVGCEYFQGYYYYRPIEPDAVEQLLFHTDEHADSSTQ